MIIFTGSEIEIESKQQAHEQVSEIFNEDVADLYIKGIDFLINDAAPVRDTMSVILLLTKAIVGSFIEKNFPNRQEGPIELRNLMYYSEQAIAQLASTYHSQETKEGEENEYSRSTEGTIITD